MTNAPMTAPDQAIDPFTWFRPGAAASPEQRLRVLLGLVAVIAIALGFAAAGPKFLNDPDTLWHVSVGKDIWLTKSFPHVDAYSHSFAGEPWIAKEWLSQVVLYAAYALGGWNGVALMAIAVMLIVTHQLYWALSASLKPLIAVAVCISALSICSDVFVARPHIIVLPIVILFVRQLWNAAQDERAPSFWMLAAVCVWANMHGSFTFGFIAAGLAFLLYLYKTRDFTSSRTMHWVGFLAMCPVASMVHPYGFESIWSTVTIVESEALPYVTEWRAFSLPQDMKVALVLLGGLALALASGFRTNIVAALFVCLLVYMYWTHTRFTYLLFTLAPLILVRDIAAQFASLSFSRWVREFENSPLDQRLASSAHIAAPALLAMLFAFGAAILASAKWSPPGTAYPMVAIEAARANGASGNVLNEYNFGGALIFEGEHTFVDGRADRLFQNGFIPKIADSMKADGAGILREQLARYDIGWTIIKPTDGRVAHLEALPEWRRVYEDEFAIVHVKEEVVE